MAIYLIIKAQIKIKALLFNKIFINILKNTLIIIMFF